MPRPFKKRSWLNPFSWDELFGLRDKSRSQSRRARATLEVLRLEDRWVPSSSPLVYNADNAVANHTIELTDESGTLDIYDNTVLVASQSAAGTTYVQINGNGSTGVVVLTVDFANGTFTNPVDFNGSTAGFNAMIIQGGTFGNETYTPSGERSGNFTFSNGSSIEFANLLPIADTSAAANFTLDDTSFGDDISIINGGNSGIFNGYYTDQINSSSENFEFINFANKNTVNVDASSGDNTINANFTTAAAGLQYLNLNGGDSTNNFNIVQPPPTSVDLHVNGGVGTNYLTGPANQFNAWYITGANSGYMNNGNGNSVVTVFSNIQNLGGQGNDTFAFIGNGSLTGGIDGNVSGGFGTGGNTTIVGNDAGDSFQVLAEDAGTITGLLGTNGFINIDNLQGGLGNDTFTFVDGEEEGTGGFLDGYIDGGYGNNTIVGDNAGDQFYIYDENSGGVDSNWFGGGYLVQNFYDIQNLTGGLGDDSFYFDGGTLDGKIDGGGEQTIGNTIYGNATSLNEFTINGYNAGAIIPGESGGCDTDPSFGNIQNLVGGGNDTFAFIGSGRLTGSINGNGTGGGAGNDTIIGTDAGDSFQITGVNSGTITGLLGTGGFTNIDNLTGGLGNDTFTFVDGGAIYDNIVGGGGNDTIVGDNSGDNFYLYGTNSGNISSTYYGGNLLYQFYNIQNLTGGLGDDSFYFDGGTLDGKINGGGEQTIGNTIYGDDNGDDFTINGYNAGAIVPGEEDENDPSFNNIQNLVGGSGDDTFTFIGSGQLTGGIDGGDGENTLTGNDSGDSFQILTENGGTITGLLGTNGFLNIGNLQGGLGNDTFTFVDAGPEGDGGYLDGSIDGGYGNNTIVGDNAGDQFYIYEENSGEINSNWFGGDYLVQGFYDVQNLTGGLGDDSFYFDGGTLDGKINGGGEQTIGNTIYGDDNGDDFTINGYNAGAIIPGEGEGCETDPSFSNIQNLVGGDDPNTFTFIGSGRLTGNITGGGSGSDTIVGNDAGDSFQITGYDSGTITGLLGTGGFTNISYLTGGLGNDTFTLVNNGYLYNNINGGGGNNTVAGNNKGDDFNIAGTNSGNVTDQDGDGIYSFSNIENLVGGLGDDNFNFFGDSTLTGHIDGGGRDGAGNTITTSNGLSNDFTISGPNSGTIAGILPAGFVNIQNLTGAGLADTFQFTNSGSLDGVLNGGGDANDGDTVIGNDSGMFFVFYGLNAGAIVGFLPNGFLNIENFVGGAGSDTFAFSPGGYLTGNIDGGGGSNTLDYAGFNGPTYTDLAANRTTALGGFFTNMSNLVGGGPSSTLAGPNAFSVWNIYGENFGAVNTSFTFFNVDNLLGGNDDNVFQFILGGFVDGIIDGGSGGQNWLNYDNDAYPTPTSPSPVAVDLLAGFATRTGGVTNIQNVRGSELGGDILIGDFGSNVLVTSGGNNIVIGLGGKDVLIGGLGNNLIVGEPGQDIIVAGATFFDNNFAALDDIQAEWVQGTPFAVRVAHVLSGGGLTNGNALELGVSVFVAGVPINSPTTTIIPGTFGNLIFATASANIENQNSFDIILT